MVRTLPDHLILPSHTSDTHDVSCDMPSHMHVDTYSPTPSTAELSACRAALGGVLVHFFLVSSASSVGL